jgi:hypothetical protein
MRKARMEKMDHAKQIEQIQQRLEKEHTYFLKSNAEIVRLNNEMVVST